MKSKGYKIVIGMAAAIVLLSGAARGQGGPAIIAGPYLQHVTKSSMTVMWETNQACTSQVKYAKQLPLKQSAGASGKSTIHEVVITGLDTGTSYFYRVRSDCGKKGKAASEVYTFQTAVAKDSAYAFVVLGDNRTFPDRFEKIAALAYGERPNFVLHVGDVVSHGIKKSEWIDEYLRPGAALMQRVPTYVAIGNHEMDAKWFYKYHSFPEPENYYSFDYGNAHFAVIDSNKKLSPGTEQYKWLDQDLANSSATWKFVAHHHPTYSSDENDYGNTEKEKSTLGDLNARQLVPLYEKHGVDIVWYGHIHDYERTWPIRAGAVDQERGVIYIQAGGGGAPLENFAPTRSWFTAKVLRNWQYCLVTIHGNTLRMMAYDIDGGMYDYLDLEK